MTMLNDYHPPKLNFGGDVEDLWDKVLLEPVRNLMDRPSKRIRAELVTLGFEFAHSDPNATNGAALRAGCEQVMESVHAGSLAIDDIQDNSEFRRGEPTLHRRVGVPLAINTGNWLYFQPLEQLRAMGLDPDRELRMYRAYHRALLQAHYGQALDVGVRIDQIPQQRVHEVCMSSLELKSGMLTSLALVLGAIAGGARDELVAVLDEFGCAFGIALQMFDDMGNVNGKKDPGKRWEDLKLKRPTWFWAWLSKNLNEVEYAHFLEQVSKLPVTEPLELWLSQYPQFVEGCQEAANRHLDDAFVDLGNRLSGSGERAAFEKLKTLGGKLRVAYQ